MRLYSKGNERLRGYKYGDAIKVDSLDPRDREEELLRIGWGKPEFTYSLNNVAANHLQTVPLLEFIGEGGYDGVFVGISGMRTQPGLAKSSSVGVRSHYTLGFIQYSNSPREIFGTMRLIIDTLREDHSSGLEALGELGFVRYEDVAETTQPTILLLINMMHVSTHIKNNLTITTHVIRVFHIFPMYVMIKNVYA